MGVFVFLPLVLPLTAWPVARLAEHHLHPRMATWLLTGASAVLAVCSTLSLALLMVVGTAQLPGNPLPDGWSDPEVREAVPYDEVAGRIAIPALILVLASCARAAWRHRRVRRRAGRALEGLPATSVVVLPDASPYAYALPGRKSRARVLAKSRARVLATSRARVLTKARGRVRGNVRARVRGKVRATGRATGGARDRVVVTTAMLATLTGPERRALFAHERAHLTARHHRFLLTVQLAARANPFLRPLRTAVTYTTERWADEEAATSVGSRRIVARAVGKAALISRGALSVTLAGFAVVGPVPRRVAALLGPARPPARGRPCSPALAWPRGERRPAPPPPRCPRRTRPSRCS
ncbi:M56 family metallopeptidase [Streptomyces sp. MBT42]|nr:M56 family metallopeptidase [Streptomyces sp. MBT42]MCD2469290.1 M56 family metallopeptidase [Streptomyces sp. MBT42]